MASVKQEYRYWLSYFVWNICDNPQDILNGEMEMLQGQRACHGFRSEVPVKVI